MREEMTREQARDTLRNAAWLGTNEDRERIERAVELLCGEPCEDAISRDAVLALPRNKVRDFKTMEVVCETINVTDIETLLPVNPQEQKPCEDCISRQAAIDAFSMFAEYESNRTNAEWVNRIRIVLSSLPPVQPIRPRGHWILVSDGTPGGYWKCSECLCHKTMGFGHTDWFCPCCGADMRESEEQA